MESAAARQAKRRGRLKSLGLKRVTFDLPIATTYQIGELVSRIGGDVTQQVVIAEAVNRLFLQVIGPEDEPDAGID